MIDANDFVRDRGAQSLFETEQPVNERSVGKLRRKGLGNRVVNIEHDFATRQSRHQSRKDQEIRQVVDMHDVELAADQQTQARSRGGQQEPEVGQQIRHRALAAVLGDPQLPDLDSIKRKACRLPAILGRQADDVEGVRGQGFRLAPNTRIPGVVGVGNHADVALHPRLQRQANNVAGDELPFLDVVSRPLRAMDRDTSARQGLTAWRPIR